MKSVFVVLWIATVLEVGLGAQENAPRVAATETVADVDGNVYKTVTIGTQVWMAEDLQTTRYRNGDLIGTTDPASKNIREETAPKYQWAYQGDETHVATYGRLYTWFVVVDPRNVAPFGWHVATDAEWTTLVKFLGGNKAAQGKLKECGTKHWKEPNEDATNESGFTALPGGNRWDNGRFLGLGEFTHWWTSTEYDSERACRVMLRSGRAANFRGCADKKLGWLVRCVRDE